MSIRSVDFAFFLSVLHTLIEGRLCIKYIYVDFLFLLVGVFTIVWDALDVFLMHMCVCM